MGKKHHQIGKLISLALLGLILTLHLPVLSAQDQYNFVALQHHQSLAQTSNAQLLQQGIELYHAEKYAEAIAVFSSALAAFTNHNPLNQALVLRYLSLAYQHLGRWQEAEGAIAQSLKLLEQSKSTYTLAGLDVLAKALNTQAMLQSVKGEWAKALETWKQAAATYQQAGNAMGAIGCAINQAEALQALGFSSQAQTQLQNIEQLLQGQPELQATGLQSLGKAYRRVGNLSKSSQILQKSLAVAQAFKLAAAESSALLELGNTKRALANQAQAIGQDATQHTQAAIAFYQQAARTPSLALQAQLNLLSLLVEIEEYSEAAELALVIQPLLIKPPSQTNIYAQLNFARSLMQLRQHSTSPVPSLASIAQIVATAVRQARHLQDRAAESYALGQLGELYEQNKQWSVAQDLTQQAFLLAAMQNPELRYRWEWQLGRLWVKQGEIAKAIAAYETAVETLKSIKTDLLTIAPEIQFSFRDRVEPVYRQLVDLLLRTKGNNQPTQANLQLATEAIDSLRLAELENFLRCNLSPTVQLNRDIHQIDRQAAFIYPIILADRLEIIVKLPGRSLQHYVTFIPQTEVEKTALELRANILKRNRPEVAIAKASQLYEWLMSPLMQDLNNSDTKTLVFVLDGVLRNIPISVLYDRQRQEYLMQKQYAIALVPDLQLFDLKPLKREKLNVLTAAVSEKKEIAGRFFNELPNAIAELQQIGDIVTTKPLLNPNFTKDNLQQLLSAGTFSAVHIATHGKFSSDPEETFILTYDRLLKSQDLNNLLRTNHSNPRQTIELLVLSACETAQGDNRAILGLAGIALQAGARSTLATLWQVSDRSTAEMMGQFYKKLTNPHLTKAEALHQAQLALFAKYKSPYYWAAYVLVGNWL